MDPNFIDYYIIDYAIPLIFTIENCYRIDFGNPGANQLRHLVRSDCGQKIIIMHSNIYHCSLTQQQILMTS